MMTRAPSGRRRGRHGRPRARRRAVALATALTALTATAVVAAGAIALWGPDHGEDAGRTGGTGGTAALLTGARPSAAASAPAAPPSPAFDAAGSITDPASPWVVVNKQHPIQPLDHEPASLTLVAGKEVSTLVAPDLQALLAAADADGVHLTVISGYRSYGYQAGVHRRAVASQGAALAERVSARAGYSEHQTGFAVDLGSRSDPTCDLQECFGATPEGVWLAEHAPSYGFLQRYTAAGSAVTGYSPEAWHYRWVGTELLQAMDARGVDTLEEFFGVSGGPVYATP